MKKTFVVAATIFCSHSFAQDSTRTLDEVIVSANKYENKTTATGKVVLVISQEDIKRSGSKDISQVLSEHGGININGSSSNPGKDKSVFLRGGAVHHTLITIDGIPVYDASGIGSNFDIRNIPIESVERIEILKGSQGTLYGSDAIAGVVNIITKKAKEKPFHLNVAASAGSYGTLRTHAAVDGRKNKWDYNAGINFYRTDGIDETIKQPGYAGTADKDGYLQLGYFTKTSYRPKENIRIAPFLRYSKYKGASDLYEAEDDFIYESDNYQAGIQNEAEFGKTRLVLQYLYNDTYRFYEDDSISRSFGSYYNKYIYGSKEHFTELYVLRQLHEKLKVTAGIDHRSSRIDIRNIFVPSFAVAPLTKNNQQQVGIYGATNFQHKGLSAEAGARYNDHSAYGNNLSYNTNISYLPGQQWKFFANLSSGYHVPGLFQLYSAFGNEDLKPEVSRNMEGGVQYIKTNLLSIRSTFFKREVNDIIFFYYDPSGGRSYYINQDRQRDHGLELDGKWNISNKTHLKAFYSLIKGKTTTKEAGKDTTYNNLYRRPRHSFSITAGHQFSEAFYTSLNAQYFGEAKDYSWLVPFGSDPNVTLKDYTLLHIYCEYTWKQKRLKVFADVRNLLNQEYMEVYGYRNMRFNAYGGFRFEL